MNHEDTFTSHSDALQPTTSSNMNVGSSRDKSTVSKDFTVDLTGAKCVVPKEENGEESSSNSSSEDEECCELSVPENFSASNTQVSVQNSNDVVVGPLTQFHGPVTIYQKTNNASEQVNNASPGIEGNGNIQLAKETKNFLAKKLTIKWTMLVIVCLICVTLTIFVALYVQANTFDVPVISKPVQNKDITVMDGAYKLIPRDRWTGLDPLYENPLKGPVKYVIIGSTRTKNCFYVDDCCTTLQTIQSIDLVSQQPDIKHNFFIGSDQNIYTGRGWDTVNAISSNSISIFFIGDYRKDILLPGMVGAAHALIQFGLTKHKLLQDYVLLTDNFTATSRDNVYKAVRTWPNYSAEFVKKDN